MVNGIETTLYRKVVIPYGQYSGSEFALALGIALNETLPTNELSPTYFAKKNTIILNHGLNTYDYKLYSDYELKNGAVWIPASNVHSLDPTIYIASMLLSEITASTNPMEEQTYMFLGFWTYRTFTTYTSHRQT